MASPFPRRRKIQLLETVTFERWDSLPSIWKSDSKEMPRLRSSSLSDILDGTEDIKDPSKPRGPKISRDHWEKRRLVQKCNDCNKQIHLVFRQKHCRMCGKIFCLHCSRYQRRLSDDASPNPDGKLYRVCLPCYKEGEDLAVGCVKSWTQDFFNMRSAAHSRKFPEGKEPELKLLCEIPKVCQPISDMFLEDISKSKQMKTKLHNAVKIAKRKTLCSQCDKDLFVPSDRKQCVVCDEIFCKTCSSKDLVVFYPRGAVHQSDEGRARPDMDVIQPGTDVSKMAEMWRNYRVCCECVKYVGRELRVFHFNLELQNKHHEMIDIKNQIVAILERESITNAHVGTLRQSSSMDMLDDLSNRGEDDPWSMSEDVFLSLCDAKLVEERVIQKLFDRYYKRYEEVRCLKPVTSTQASLQKKIISSSTNFYNETRRSFRDRYTSLSSTGSNNQEGHQ
ncbi:vacuolar segregation protein PEP7-like isoform X2 [Haliotis rubra]|uniref:vacuolar segregation protein PEP7-like isoform X2 n=1 Tax=Haliotis rubra TaxID=36100 RepID=UPI001EE5F715|nr:vacuolar segregation protein PEP7-like isoform X2 [Haliotis rubra]